MGKEPISSSYRIDPLRVGRYLFADTLENAVCA